MTDGRPDVSEPDRPSGAQLRKLRQLEERFSKPGITDATPMPDDSGPSMVQTRNGMPLDIEPIEPRVVPAVRDPNEKNEPIRLEREVPMTATEVIESMARALAPSSVKVQLTVRLYAGDVLVAETDNVKTWLELMGRFGGAR